MISNANMYMTAGGTFILSVALVPSCAKLDKPCLSLFRTDMGTELLDLKC